jgi:hypothetical protein
MNTDNNIRLKKMDAALQQLNRAVSPWEYAGVWAGQDEAGNHLYTLISPRGTYSRRNYIEFMNLIVNLTIAANGRGVH